MPEAHCSCCRKSTQHKVVMRRSVKGPASSWQAVQYFFSMLVQGEHYYKMEKQMFCRECNHQTSITKPKFTGVDTVNV